MTRAFLALHDHLRDRGVRFEDATFKCDAAWTHDTAFMDSIVDLGIPTIVQDPRCFPDLIGNIRAAARRDNVRRIIKTSVLASGNYNVRPAIAAASPLTVAHLIGATDFVPHDPAVDNNKVELALGLLVRGYIRKTKPDVLDRHRSRDLITCLGRIDETNYPDKPIREHRLLAIEASKKLPFPCYVKANDDPFWANEWWAGLQDSKACLSPIGFDATARRDLEAASVGTVIIRPDISWCRTWPQLEFITCKTDFSDLAKVVGDIRENWNHYAALRRRNFDLVNACNSPDVFADRIVQIVTSALATSTQSQPQHNG